MYASRSLVRAIVYKSGWNSPWEDTFNELVQESLFFLRSFPCHPARLNRIQSSLPFPRLINSNWVRVWPGLSAGLPGSPKMRLPGRVLHLPGKKCARATFTLVILAPYLLISAVSDDLLPPLRRPRFRLKLDFYFRGYLRNLSTDFGMDFEL